MSQSPYDSVGSLERPQSPTLEVGIERRMDFFAQGPLLTDVGGTIGTSVLSTPGMIAMIEANCTVLALEHLPDGRATVGFEVCVKHVAAALAGTECLIHARLGEIREARKLRFEVTVYALDGDDPEGRVIGLGTHERRVIDVSQHSQSAGR